MITCNVFNCYWNDGGNTCNHPNVQLTSTDDGIPLLMCQTFHPDEDDEEEDFLEDESFM